MIFKIALCSSAKFFDKLEETKRSLEERMYEVIVPDLERYKTAKPEDKISVRGELIKNYLQEISYCHAIYVANHDKNDIPGYIGGNVLLEMGKAFELELPIFLLSPFSKKLGYAEEVECMGPIVIGEDWNRLDALMREKYGMDGLSAFEIEQGNGSTIDPLVFKPLDLSKD